MATEEELRNAELKKQQAWVQLLQQFVPAIYGMGMLAGFLYLATRVPNPTTEQFFIYRVVLALAAGGFACLLTGSIEINVPTGWIWKGTIDNLSPPAIKAAGAIGVVAFVLMCTPETDPTPDLSLVESTFDVPGLGDDRKVPTKFNAEGTVTGIDNREMYLWVVIDRNINSRWISWPKKRVAPNKDGTFKTEIEELGEPGKPFRASLYVTDYSAHLQFVPGTEVPENRIVGAKRISTINNLIMQ